MFISCISFHMTTDTTNLHSDRIDNSRELYNISNIHIDTYHINSIITSCYIIS